MFWATLKMALEQIFNQHHGPAVLLIPRDLFDREVSARPNNFSILLSDYKTIPKIETKYIEKLLCAIGQAKHPLVIIGSGMRHASIMNSLKKLVDHFDLTVATTLADVNAFPHDNPHYLGMIGIAGHPGAHHYLKHKVDLVIAIGSEFSAMVKIPIESNLIKIKIRGSDLQEWGRYLI